MQPDASTSEGESKKPVPPSRRPFRASPKTDAILARLRYVGDYLFSGNIAAYAAATGFTESWLARILREDSRCRLSTFAQFVESRLVSAEWLFCGSGPMLHSDVKLTDIATYQPPTFIRSRHAIFDTTLLSPLMRQPFAPEIPLNAKPNKAITKACLPVARAVFAARAAHKPVILFLSADVIEAGTSLIINELLRQKIVTGVAMTTAAAIVDLSRAQQHKNISALNDVLRLAAKTGVGFAEGVGRWGLQPEDSRGLSILATAHDLCAAATVHANFGDSDLYFNAATGGASFGADIGATSYVDFLVFADMVAQLAGDPAGVFITTGPAAHGLQLLSSAMAAGQRLSTPLRFNALKIARFSGKPAKQNLDYLVTAKYSELFPAFFSACTAIYEGNHNGHSDGRKTTISS